MSEVMWADFTVTVAVTINDPEVLERITGPGGDEWRSQFYGSMKTAEDVYRHLAWNYLQNGIERVNQLEGWGDLADDAVTFTRQEFEPDEVREPSCPVSFIGGPRDGEGGTIGCDFPPIPTEHGGRYVYDGPDDGWANYRWEADGA